MKKINVDINDVYDFLDNMLKNPDPEFPVRGPILKNSLNEHIFKNAEDPETIIKNLIEKRDEVRNIFLKGNFLYINCIPVENICDFDGYDIVNYILFDDNIIQCNDILTCKYQGGILGSDDPNDLF